MNSDNVTLGEWIRQTREALGWSKARLAEEMGVTERAVRYWESGERRPSLPTIKLLKIHAINSK